jgi:hypothetical protein
MLLSIFRTIKKSTTIEKTTRPIKTGAPQVKNKRLAKRSKLFFCFDGME